MSRREHDRHDNDYDRVSRHDGKEEKRTHGHNDDHAKDRDARDRKHDRHKDSRHSHKKKSRKSDHHHDDKGRKRRRHSIDEGDRKSRKIHRDDDDKKRRRKHKERKDRKRNKHDKDDSYRRKSSKVDKSKLIDLGDPLGEPPTQPLDEERDYFAFHEQFWVYLYREEGVTFNDLSSDEARKAFARFVALYNSGKLEKAYYDGLPSAVLEQCKTTRHNWSFNISEREDQSLYRLQEGIRKQTEYSSEKNKDGLFKKEDTNFGRSSIQRNAEEEPPSMPSADRHAERATNRRLREHVRAAEEEFSGGRREGRERQIEKRKELADKIHRASRDRDAAMELTDDALYGEGQSSFSETLRREKARTARREEKKSKRVAGLQEKEKEKQEEMLKMLGLSGIKPGQKITIAPRKDGS